MNVMYYVYIPMYYGKLVEAFSKNTNKFMELFIIIISLNLVSYLSFQYEQYNKAMEIMEIKEMLREKIVNNIYKAFDKDPSDVAIGHKMASIFKAQEIIALWYSDVKEYLIPYAITIITTIFLMYSMDYILPVIMSLLLLSIYVMTQSNLTYCAPKHIEKYNQYLKVYQEAEDRLSNVMAIKIYDQIQNESDLMNEFKEKYESATESAVGCTFKWNVVATVLIAIFITAIMYRSYILLKTNRMSKTNFLSLYFVVINLLSKLIWLTDIFNNITSNYVSLSELEEDISIAGMFNSNNNAMNSNNNSNNNSNGAHNNIRNNREIIRIDNISFKYSDAKHYVIQNFNASINRGERLLLYSDIGKGKTTLLKIILGLIKPNLGNLYINGINYNKLSKHRLYANFGFMMQNPLLFNRSIADNILYSNSGKTKEDVSQLLDYFNLKDVFNDMEHGVDTLVGKNGHKLSGGQKQIIWFLRIYLRNPDILILDEPTASLSEQSKTKLWELIEKGFRNKTIVMASHDKFIIEKATRTIRL